MWTLRLTWWHICSDAPWNPVDQLSRHHWHFSSSSSLLSHIRITVATARRYKPLRDCCPKNGTLRTVYWVPIRKRSGRGDYDVRWRSGCPPRPEWRLLSNSEGRSSQLLHATFSSRSGMVSGWFRTPALSSLCLLLSVALNTLCLLACRAFAYFLNITTMHIITCWDNVSNTDMS